MTLVSYVCQRLAKFGVPARHDGKVVFVTADTGEEKKIKFGDEWNEAYKSFAKAKSVSFDNDYLSLTLNKSIEFPLVSLDIDRYKDETESFSDEQGNNVLVSTASFEFSLAHFDSADYDEFFNDYIKKWLDRISPDIERPGHMLFWRPATARYTHKGRKTPANLNEKAIERIEACLLKMAVEKNSCYKRYKPRPKKSPKRLGELKANDNNIPIVSYEKNVSNFYLVARSSHFPSQSFLAYYHVLEYYFLIVAEDLLHNRLKALINSTDFKSNSSGIASVIALVHKQANKDNEEEMLRKVLQRFVDEEEFINYVNTIETKFGDKLYSKRRSVFGEQLVIDLREGHALSNAGRLIKHVRNAIAHSSDKYSRDECHIPLSETEDVISEFIPLVRYFAEKVIFGTANAHQH